MLKSRFFAIVLTLFTIHSFAENNPTSKSKSEGTTGIQFFSGTFKQALAKAKQEKN
jgi:outer membrane lipoprotein-sorting protein